ncbi:TPA: copper transporter [Clostridioides difficile]|nr:copper transporter [Clostridioides difficile]
MHINMKYYIVTIGAIFIALGIGMLVGFNLNNNQQLSEQQANIIDDLDDKFDILKEKNDKLDSDLASVNRDYEEAVNFINKNVDKILAGSLNGKSIGIISANENDDYTKNIEDIINKSNGSIAFNIILKENITNPEKLKEMSTKLGTDVKNANDAVNYIIDTLKKEDASDILTYLQELDVIKFNFIGDTYLKYDSVVIAGGNDAKDSTKQFEKIEKFVVSKLKSENKYLVEVQNTGVKTSYVELYSKNKVATIDNIDEGIGSISLAILLQQGNIVGNFGRLDTATSLLPSIK